MITTCPHCSNEFYVPKDAVGTKVPCSKCRQEVRIVSQSAMQTGRGLMSKPTPQLWNEVNMREGFKRLALVASFLLGPIIWSVIKARDLYTLNASFSEPIDNSLRFIIIWCIGFTGVWVAYVTGSLLIRGFAIGHRSRQRKKRSLPLYLLGIISLVPLIPGGIGAWHYVHSNPIWYWEDLLQHFIPWPAAGFATVWGAYLITLFVGSGFLYKNSDQVLADIRRLELGTNRPDVLASWRTH